MVESARMILRGGMQIGLRGMAGVTRFGKQGQVGQAEPDNQILRCLQTRLMRFHCPPGLDENEDERRSEYGEQDKSDIRWTAHQRYFFMVDTILSTGVPRSSTATSLPSVSTT